MNLVDLTVINPIVELQGVSPKSVAQIIDFIQILKTAIEDPKQRRITWNKPFIQIKLRRGVCETCLEKKPEDERNKADIEAMEEPIQELEELWKKEIFAFPITVELENTKEVGKHEFKDGLLRMRFYPRKSCIRFPLYYLIYVGLDFKDSKLNLLNKKDKQKFWDLLIKRLTNGLELTEVHFEDLGPAIVQPARRETTIKAGLHLELQKRGRKPEPDQRSLFDLLDEPTKKEAVKYGVEVVGVDLTDAQNKAVFAVQSLLNNTDYRGNLPGRQVDNKENTFKFSGSVPVLKFTPAEYFEAYGVGKRATSRGYMEYNANERAEALKALRDLHVNKFLFYYERRYWGKNNKGQEEELFDVIRTVRPLIIIIEGYEALTRSERDTLRSGATTQETEDKLKVIVIELSPIFVDQIKSYFVVKPANCYQEIKLLAPHASKYVSRFIDYLRSEVAKREIASKGKGNQNWAIKVNYETLAYTLRMYSWIKGKQWNQIRGSLKKCYETAKQLGYLLDYKTIQGVTKELEELTLNPEKFYRVKEMEEKGKKIETKEPVS